MPLAERLSNLRRGFHRTFWVANTLELFERFASYGSKAVLAVYLAEMLGLGLQVVGPWWERFPECSISAGPNSTERHGAAAYCAGFIEIDPISRVSSVTQLICKLNWLGVRV